MGLMGRKGAGWMDGMDGMDYGVQSRLKRAARVHVPTRKARVVWRSDVAEAEYDRDHEEQGVNLCESTQIIVGHWRHTVEEGQPR